MQIREGDNGVYVSGIEEVWKKILLLLLNGFTTTLLPTSYRMDFNLRLIQRIGICCWLLIDGHLSFGLYYVETGESILCWVGRWVSCWWGLGGMQIQVKSVEDCMKLLILGDRNRCFAFTKLVSSVVGKLSPKKWEKKEKKGVECQQQHTPSKLHCRDFSMDCRRNWQKCLTLLLLVAGYRMHIPPGVMWLLSWQLRKRQSIKHSSKRQNWLNAVVWALASWRVRG